MSTDIKMYTYFTQDPSTSNITDEDIDKYKHRNETLNQILLI